MYQNKLIWLQQSILVDVNGAKSLSYAAHPSLQFLDVALSSSLLKINSLKCMDISLLFEIGWDILTQVTAQKRSTFKQIEFST